ncbi:hypothetical protein, variant [Plasmodium yoelii 17X]|uniref:CCAAT-box DNA binding protein subunit B n=4 Tax=Plasmodium yoelii TaxID=5861 RepID=A0AAF0B2T0_PLAYO|nr:conserved Plasmodium protein, unknown function [Plasmodium yoelii]EAA21892.1 CCAAT-box DNA binding protein subunit B [Plasmodium yoelii yoelii]ETB59922.1 hypothetical protein YYC_03277 [Plasmodium yoelii 17X]ETB59923.1 hypothetical protein, variant [Plasmodium yoelii 17X]WBY57748.1 hypothetical protein Py17XNL_001002085 [Plasmodium yoelii yoelii]CDU84867.1 conserved Plasmodium protein, unknown function [Plasmodium yoelii]|eukprot:XP_730327.1 conserved Plasmodium protein, unknown function [Plasmodium yoelii]
MMHTHPEKGINCYNVNKVKDSILYEYAYGNGAKDIDYIIKKKDDLLRDTNNVDANRVNNKNNSNTSIDTNSTTLSNSNTNNFDTALNDKKNMGTHNKKKDTQNITKNRKKANKTNKKKYYDNLDNTIYGNPDISGKNNVTNNNSKLENKDTIKRNHTNYINAKKSKLIANLNFFMRVCCSKSSYIKIINHYFNIIYCNDLNILFKYECILYKFVEENENNLTVDDYYKGYISLNKIPILKNESILSKDMKLYIENNHGCLKNNANLESNVLNFICIYESLTIKFFNHLFTKINNNEMDIYNSDIDSIINNFLNKKNMLKENVFNMLLNISKSYEIKNDFVIDDIKNDEHVKEQNEKIIFQMLKNNIEKKYNTELGEFDDDNGYECYGNNAINNNCPLNGVNCDGYSYYTNFNDNNKNMNLDNFYDLKNVRKMNNKSIDNIENLNKSNESDKSTFFEVKEINLSNSNLVKMNSNKSDATTSATTIEPVSLVDPGDSNFPSNMISSSFTTATSYSNFYNDKNKFVDLSSNLVALNTIIEEDELYLSSSNSNDQAIKKYENTINRNNCNEELYKGGFNGMNEDINVQIEQGDDNINSGALHNSDEICQNCDDISKNKESLYLQNIQEVLYNEINVYKDFYKKNIKDDYSKENENKNSIENIYQFLRNNMFIPNDNIYTNLMENGNDVFLSKLKKSDKTTYNKLMEKLDTMYNIINEFKNNIKRRKLEKDDNTNKCYNGSTVKQRKRRYSNEEYDIENGNNGKKSSKNCNYKKNQLSKRSTRVSKGRKMP